MFPGTFAWAQGIALTLYNPNLVLTPCPMQPSGVEAGCMVFALTCNLKSVVRKGPEGHILYFLRTIHAYVPTAQVILVCLSPYLLTRLRVGRDGQDSYADVIPLLTNTSLDITRLTDLSQFVLAVPLTQRVREPLNCIYSHTQIGTHVDVLPPEVRDAHALVCISHCLAIRWVGIVGLLLFSLRLCVHCMCFIRIHAIQHVILANMHNISMYTCHVA